MHPLKPPGRPVAWLVIVAAWLALLALPTACGSSKPPTKKRDGVTQARNPNLQRGKASWYGGKHHGGPTASGERYNKRAMTAAHKTWPMGTRVRVTNLKNGRSVVLRINDRGPYVKGRIIDVSEVAAEQLDMIDAGVVPCAVERLR